MSTGGTLVTPFNVEVYLNVDGAATSGDTGAFTLSYSGISREACVQIAASDRGSNASTGFIAMTASGTTVAPTVEIPSVFAEIYTLCQMKKRMANTTNKTKYKNI